MKILIFSDSHGQARNMKSAIDMHAADTDAVMHLGDGKREFMQLMDSYPDISRVCVRGNYEDPYSRSAESVAVIELGGMRFFLTHGHAFGVKRGISELIAAAADRDCDIALYGHTHVQDMRYFPADESLKKPLWVVNPGSITIPHDGWERKYAIIRIAGSKPLISLAKIE